LPCLNDYWLADADTYAVAGRQLNLSHCFERIFLVSDQGTVNELAVVHNHPLQATRQKPRAPEWER
jgi:hypothetical protein